MDANLCNQTGCGLPVEFVYTWPGRDLAGSCGLHTEKAKALADALGFHLEIIPVVELL